jgi:hypothetical protein
MEMKIQNYEQIQIKMQNKISELSEKLKQSGIY